MIRTAICRLVPRRPPPSLGRVCSGLAQRVPALSLSATPTGPPADPPQVGPAATGSVDEKLSAQDAIKRSFSRERYSGVISAFEEAQTRGLSLDSETYNLVLGACTRLAPSPQVSKAARAAYRFFARSTAVPIEVIHKVVQFALAAEDVPLAVDAYRLFNRRYRELKGRERLLYPVTSLLARSTVKRAPAEIRAEGRQQALGNMLNDMQMLFKSGVRPPDELLFAELARAFSHLAQSENLLQTLIEMTAARYEPSVGLCEELLENALWDSDRKVLAVLLGWFANNFVDHRLELGRINRILHVASSRGDESIARLGFKMLERSGRTPELTHYVCWTRACLLSSNLNGAMEALLEAQVQGHDVLNSEFGQALQALIADTFKMNFKMLDGIYFSLVDLRRGEYKVPQIVLNALIVAAGRLNQLDRAFATFQEYRSLFGHKQDIHAFNALLQAIAYSRFPSVSNQLTIMEDLVAAGYQPSDESFSILLSTMSETGEMMAYDDIVAYIKELQKKPSARSLRKIVLRLARDNQEDRLKSALDLLRHVSGDQDPPSFLRKRIKSLCAVGNSSNTAESK